MGGRVMVAKAVVTATYRIVARNEPFIGWRYTVRRRAPWIEDHTSTCKSPGEKRPRKRLLLWRSSPGAAFDAMLSEWRGGGAEVTLMRGSQVINS